MKKITNETLLNKIKELLDWNAFEMQVADASKGTLDLYIPYIMNDAMECFLQVRNVYIQGEYLTCFDNDTTVELLETDQRPALVFHQGSTNVFTIWFEECYQLLNCYRYDQTGHFWRRGAEQWRRLVYIIGTIHDKYNYMGTDVCNKEELELLHLMGFAPFRRYSPIRESLNDLYPETEEGLLRMTEYAKEAEDKFFLSLLNLYEKFQCTFTSALLFRALNSAGRSNLYQLIYTKMECASQQYPEREYSAELNEYIRSCREEVSSVLKQHGFRGSYPLFHKKKIQVFAVEEHPFTILEAENYSFRIQFMVSESSASIHSLNFGFFQKKGNRGRIEKNLDFLNSRKMS